MSALKSWLLLDEAGEISDLDHSDTYDAHRRIICSKPLLKEIYAFYFDQLLRPFQPFGGKRVVEIGAGSFNAKDFLPNVITSDITRSNYVDMAVDAQKMPFEDCSLDGLIMLDTLHHLQEPGSFFREAQRTLKPEGLIVMVEPYFSLWGNFVYTRLHHEPVIITDSWDLPTGSSGRLSGANIITPFQIFHRDRHIFADRYKDLKIETIQRHTCFNYLLSGGLTYRSFIPRFMDRMVWAMERGLKPFYGLLATSMTVVIRKELRN